MRIFAIGLGGAGCRIADMLYGQDRQFSKVSCVEAIAIDRDPETLNHLAHIPVGKRIYFPSVSLLTDDITDDITTDEIINLLHNLDTGDKDAIILCTGAGGTMAGVGVAILEKIKSTVVEPVFGLVTLPALGEGKRTSAKAAQDINRLLPLVEGVIIFDNEKMSFPSGEEKNPRTGAYQRFNPLSKTGTPDDRLMRYKTANTGIARRLGLLLRAGEINEGGEIETGEVVLDAGEILNTIRGMGFIAIGYAAADVSGEKFHIGSLFHPSGARVESGHKKAERLVDLAKEAIYENISVPCDLTSAEKALILVAGPSQAISLKGFMTVRKWIDRSIAGMEMRSGDYPVKNTRYIAIIIILAGLKNIPRIKEIRAIRDEYSTENPGWELEWHNQVYLKEGQSPGISKKMAGHTTRSATTSAGHESVLKDGRTRDPDRGQQKSSAPGPVTERSPVKNIPFFNRYRSMPKTDKDVPGDVEITSPDNTTTTVFEPGKGHHYDKEQVKDVPEIPEISASPQTEDTVTGIGGKEQDPPVTIRAVPEPAIEVTAKTDLATVVARAREDLKKMDEKR
jgi:cell division GTPase FtsZ